MSEGEFYVGGFVLCQIIEQVMFARWVIFALRNITFILDTQKRLKHIQHDVRPEILKYI